MFETERGERMQAPDFNKGYPSGGAMIGPAWQAMWDLTGEQRWTPRFVLVAVAVAASGCKPKTAENLLDRAVIAHLLVRNEKDPRSNKRYRRDPDMPPGTTCGSPVAWKDRDLTPEEQTREWLRAKGVSVE